MPFKLGHPKLGGRKRNVSNKLTSDIREMIRAALDKAGGVAYLVAQAEANPTAFMALLGKIIPKEMEATITNRPVSELTHDELLAILHASGAAPPREALLIEAEPVPEPGEYPPRRH